MTKTTTTAPDEIRATVRRLIADAIAPAAAAVDAEGRFPDGAIEALAGAGLLGLAAPRDAGGMGEGMGTFAAVTEEIAAACASTAMVWVMHTTALCAIAAGRDERLPAIVAARELCSIAATEPGSRSFFWLPMSELRERAGRLEITATKRFVTAAGHARHFVCLSRRPGAAAPVESTAYLVGAGDPGVRLDPRFDGLGLRGNESGRMDLEAHVVEPRDLLGPHGEGLTLVSGAVLPWFSVGTAAMAHGLCRAAVGATARHLRDTVLAHDGSRLRDLAPLRARLAEMSVRTEAARALLGAAIAEIEAGSADATLRVLEARHAAVNAACDVTDLAMKTCGGSAFVRPSPVERAFRDARAGWVMAPTSDALADMIGRALTGLPIV
ncbi:MAG TPA: acyl-CoA dehydrogenase family protein [Polyangia bacterium]|jgi:alkylation response protein AidB-like acyl-CoA dehydrogenase